MRLVVAHKINYENPLMLMFTTCLALEIQQQKGEDGIIGICQYHDCYPLLILALRL